MSVQVSCGWPKLFVKKKPKLFYFSCCLINCLAHFPQPLFKFSLKTWLRKQFTYKRNAWKTCLTFLLYCSNFFLQTKFWCFSKKAKPWHYENLVYSALNIKVNQVDTLTGRWDREEWIGNKLQQIAKEKLSFIWRRLQKLQIWLVWKLIKL